MLLEINTVPHTAVSSSKAWLNCLPWRATAGTFKDSWVKSFESCPKCHNTLNWFMNYFSRFNLQHRYYMEEKVVLTSTILWSTLPKAYMESHGQGEKTSFQVGSKTWMGWELRKNQVAALGWGRGGNYSHGSVNWVKHRSASFVMSS